MLDQLHEYQEQAYLLDPFLESLVSPVVGKIKAFAHDYRGGPQRAPSGRRVERLSLLLYGYIKFRGYKTISSSRLSFEVPGISDDCCSQILSP